MSETQKNIFHSSRKTARARGVLSLGGGVLPGRSRFPVFHVQQDLTVGKAERGRLESGVPVFSAPARVA